MVLIAESPVRKLKDNASYDIVQFRLNCHCGQDHKTGISRKRGWDKLKQVMGMLQLVRDVKIDYPDAVEFGLDLAIPVLEKQIRQKLGEQK